MIDLPGEAGGSASRPKAGERANRGAELVEDALDRVRAGLPVGDLPPEVRERLRDGLVDELLGGARTEQEIVGPGGLLGNLTRRLVERAMSAELTEHLGYEPGEAPPGGAGNARNGATRKTLQTEQGPVAIEAPRDRAGSFEPRIVRKRQRRFEGFDEKIVAMHARGMTTRDIEAHLAEIYGASVGRDTISRVTAAVLEDARQWQARPLESVYPIVFLDALQVKIRDGNAIRKHSVYLAMGVDTDGERDVLGMWFQKTEGAKFWLGVLTELRQRGLEDVLVCCVDGLTGFGGMITEARVKALKEQGVGFITSLRAPQIRALTIAPSFQLSLFDERCLCEVTTPQHPDERLIVCRNPAVAAERARKREDLLVVTQRDLEQVKRMVDGDRGRLRSASAGKIGEWTSPAPVDTG